MSITQPVLKIDPRVRRTKKAIEEAFFALVQEKGFSSVTVQDITERAEINRATFYIHYRDKEDLFRHLVSEGFDAILAQHLKVAPTLTPDSLKTLVKVVFSFLDQTYQGCETHDDDMQSQVEVQVRNKIEGLLQEWLRNRRQSPDARFIEPDSVASMLAWLIFGAAMRWQQMKNKPPLEGMVEETMMFLSGGLRSSGYW